MSDLSRQSAPPIRVYHPDELHATFFLPTADYLPIDKDARLPRWVPLDNQQAIATLQDHLDELWAEPIDSVGNALPLLSVDSFTTDSAVKNFSRLLSLGSIVSFRPHVGLSSDDAARIRSFQTAERALGDAIGKRSSAGTRSRLRNLKKSLSRPGTLGSEQSTIAVCTIPLRLLGEVASTNLTIAATPGYLDPENFPPDVSMFDIRTWKYVRFSRRDWEVDGGLGGIGLLSDRLIWALHIAMAQVDAVESSIQMLTRHPLDSSTVERLPSTLPVLVHRGPSMSSSQQGVYPLAINTQQLHAPPLLREPFSGDELDDVLGALDRVENGAFTSHYDLHRDALVSHYRAGNYRDAVLLYAISVESLLDELIMHLQWEEGMTPEESVTALPEREESIVRRVSRELGKRIGGQWATKTPGRVHDWYEFVVRPRNKVVHASYNPTRAEAAVAQAAHDALVSWLCDLVATPRTLNKYPGTALTIVGTGGLERRKVSTSKIERMIETAPDATVTPLFQRWKAVRQLLIDDRTERRVPDLSDVQVLAVILDSRSRHWVAYSPHTALAALIEIDELQLEQAQRKSLESIVEQMSVRQSEPVSVAIDFEGMIADNDLEWVESYRLLPLHGVMVGQNDLEFGYNTAQASK